MAVAILLEIGLVVLLVVGDHIAHGEAVMGGDEIDAGPGPPPLLVEHVGGAGDAGSELRQHALVAAPVAPHRIPVTVVPLRPTRREVAELIAAGADIPGLGN